MWKDYEFISRANLKIFGGTLSLTFSQICKKLERRGFQFKIISHHKDNKLVGYAIITRYKKDCHNCGFDNYIYISQIAVLPSEQKQGYGKEILDKIIEEKVKDFQLLLLVKKRILLLYIFFKKE